MIAALDRRLAAAAAYARARYASSSITSFAGHEACTPAPAVNQLLYPNARGERALAALVSRSL